MKNLVLFSLLFLISICNSNAQVFHSVSVEAGPLYSYRYIHNRDNGNLKTRFNIYSYPDISSRMKHNMDSVERADLGYSFGFNYHLRKNRIGFTTGIEYSTFGEREKKMLPKKRLIDNNYYAYIEEYQFSYFYRQVSVPLEFSYCVYNKKTKLFLVLGPQLNYFFSNGIKYPADYAAGNFLFRPFFKEDLANYNSFTIGAAGGIRIEREITSKTSIGIEPGFFTHLTPVLHIENELMQYNYFGRLSFSVIRKIK